MTRANRIQGGRDKGCRGVTLTELMVSVVLLAVVALSAAKFFMTPAFLTEARRMAAVEKASGMLDCMTCYGVSRSPGFYAFDDGTGEFSHVPVGHAGRLPMWILADYPPLYYTCEVLNANTMLATSDAHMMREVKLDLFVDEYADTSAFATFRLLVPVNPHS